MSQSSAGKSSRETCLLSVCWKGFVPKSEAVSGCNDYSEVCKVYLEHRENAIYAVHLGRNAEPLQGFLVAAKPFEFLENLLLAFRREGICWFFVLPSNLTDLMLPFSSRPKGRNMPIFFPPSNLTNLMLSFLPDQREGICQFLLLHQISQVQYYFFSK